MRIVEIYAYHVRIPLRKPVRHASHTRHETDNLIVRLRLDDGSEGFGEGVPREYVTGETIDSALRLLSDADLAARFATQNVETFPDAIQAAEQLTLPSVPGDERRCQGNAARCALELAYLDAAGKRFGQPMSAVTRSVAGELWEPRDRVQYSTAITSASGFKAKLAAWAMWFYGFAQCKVKVGIAGQDDVARLRSIRKRVGRKMDLRVDANEAWTPDKVVQRIRALEPFGISAVEQPVAHEHVGCLAEVGKQIATPIMLDESLCGMVDAEAVVRDKTAELFNLRLSKCGGFIPTLRLAQFARRHGLGYQLGCQVGETAILSAAGRHFACSVRGIRYLEGSYDRRLVKEALASKDLTFGYGGWAPALSGPGLGITIDESALERVTVRKERLLG